MPVLISETDIKLERRDLERRVSLPRAIDPDTRLIIPPARTPGLHLSGLLKYVAQKSRITSYMDEIAEEELPLRWALGQAVEEFTASLYPDMLWQPGEMQEPVIMNCDGVEYLDEIKDNAIIEFKCNRSKKYSGKDLIKKKWLWVSQGKGYTLGYGPEYVAYRVWSLFEFPDPTLTQYLVKFSRVEQAEMQHMIDVNREGAIAAGYAE